MIQTATSVWVAAAVLVFVAALLQSSTGFGFNLVASPLLAILFPPRISVPALLVLWIPLGLLLCLDCRREMRFPRVGMLTLGGICGLPLGARVLGELPTPVLREVIGVAALAAALVFAIRPGRPVLREWIGCLAAGFGGGVLGAVSAMSGPPVVLFGVNQGWETRGFRADLIGFFTLLSLAAVAVLSTGRLLDGHSLSLAGVLAAPALVGLAVGSMVAPRLSAANYRKVALVVVFTGGVVSLLMGMGVIPGPI